MVPVVYGVKAAKYYMNSIYHHLANAVLLSHALFVVFVVLGLILIVWGGYRQWAWIRNTWFRAIHLAAIGIVVAQSWGGIVCPLTTFEMWLRQKAGETQYTGGFIQYWLQRLLFFDAPLWVFILVYSLFGGLILLAWVRFPPNFFRRGYKPD